MIEHKRERPAPLRGHRSCGSFLHFYLARRLRLGRLITGTSKTELAQRLGRPVQYVRHFEDFMQPVSPQELMRILEALDLEIGWLYDALPREMGRRATSDAPSARPSGSD